MSTPRSARSDAIRATAIVLPLLILAGARSTTDPVESGAPDGPIAITGVTVHPIDRQAALIDQTVLIEGDRIIELGPRERVRIPDGALEVDGSGKYLIPGLFDMHVHLREQEAEPHLRLYVTHGVTTIQSMDGSPWHLELRERLRRGELIGPRMLTTGPTTASVGISTPEEARQLVRDQKAAGYDAIKQYGNGRSTMDRELYAALMAAARQAGMRVVGHAPRRLPFSAVLEERQSSIDHMEEIVYTSRAIGELFEPYLEIQFGRASVEDHPEVLQGPPNLDQLEPVARELAEQVRRAGLAVTPTLVAFATILNMTTDEFYRLDRDPRLRYIHPVTRLQWGPGFNRYRSGGWADQLELMATILKASHQLQMRLTAAFHRAGVPILTGTDAPLPYVFPGSSLHEELGWLVESGLTPYEALRAATVEPARYLGLEDEVGIVRAGLRADLVLLDADPLADIRNSRRISGVVLRGQWLPSEQLRSMQAEIAASYRTLGEEIGPVAEALRSGRVEEALERYAALADPELAPVVERAVNTLGYRSLRNGDVEEAIRVFTLNTEHFPEAFNTWDSLAEAYMVRGDDELAIRYYRKSLELNPSNDNARAMIDRIRSGGDR